MSRCGACPGDLYSKEKAGICLSCPDTSRVNEDKTECGNYFLFKFLARKELNQELFKQNKNIRTGSKLNAALLLVFIVRWPFQINQ